MVEFTAHEYQADQSVEEGLTNVNSIMQELRMTIVDLEKRATPSTSPEEVASREELTKYAITNLEAYEAQCLENYSQAT